LAGAGENQGAIQAPKKPRKGRGGVVLRGGAGGKGRWGGYYRMRTIFKNIIPDREGQDTEKLMSQGRKLKGNQQKKERKSRTAGI